ncbi:putative RDD family membrane protein YckC [Catenuloplanes nepalensis]|uniref:RDD family membrane protein YckC n=1 Tax=Catenuloplanes nepalensis TaxID=587533 RepID=A0ABT9MU68_9ACTN|nr:RDD family protein [Catenuloplanes nepalensis]MDP9794996.1 putative RDD family membrane protein YckC [Catenuloplanes nepalensis]
MSDQPPYPPSQPGQPGQYPAQSPGQYPVQPSQPLYPAYPPGFAEPVAPDGRPLADAGRRLAARLVDGVIVALVAAVVAGAIGGGLTALAVAIGGDESPLVPATGITSIVLLMLATQYVYEVEVPLRWRFQTPGKRMLKLAIASLEPHAPLTRGRLTNRWLVSLGFNLLSNCYVGVIDPLWCLWDKPYRQCLHDKPARTVVVRVR